MAEAGPPLEGDGYVDAIYSYLWMKSQDRRSCPNILVPDTVIYKYRHIAQVSSDQGCFILTFPTRTHASATVFMMHEGCASAATR